MGKPGSVALRYPKFAVQNCDLLVCLGTSLNNVVTAFDPVGFGRVATRVLIDIDPAEIAKLGDAIDIPICADLGEFIPALVERIREVKLHDFQAWIEKCQSWKKKYQVDDFGDDEKISHYQFVYALAAAVPENTLITTGSSGLGIEVFYSAFKNKQGQRIFLTSGLGAMGYGLPASIGACIANGSKSMVAVESDGSLQLNLQEFNTLKALQLPMHLFILNNSGYGSIRSTQRNYFEGRYVGTGPEAQLFLPELKKIAAVYDFPFVRIDNPAEMDVQIAEVLAQPGPVICEVVLQEYEGLRPIVSAIVQPDVPMISMPPEDMAPLLSLDEMKEIMGDYIAPASLKVDRND